MNKEIQKNKSIAKFLYKQSTLDTLRFITCGSVDDGKSTLIGRMLFESKLIFEDQLISLQNDSKKQGTQGGDIDFALLVDGLTTEREQGITIDVAYKFFSTDNRKFIIIDTPGHEQYTRNMVTGASNADLAIILIDARKGMLTQTRRHSIICSKLGVHHIIVAINKMDLVNYQEKVFKNIQKEFKNFCKKLNFKTLTAIPMSALKGDNIIQDSKMMPWYKGLNLLRYLENIDTQKSYDNVPLRFPVQWVNRPNSNFRGFSGTIVAGKAKIGQSISVMPSFETAKIKNIILFEDQMKIADTGQAVTLILDKELDVSRGDLIISSNTPCKMSDHFEANLVWMDKETGYIGRNFWLKLGTMTVNAHITKIKHKLNVDNFDNLSATHLDFNDLSVVNIKVDRAIPFECYKDCKALGSFILIDKLSNKTVAAGMIEFELRRASNIHLQKLDIDKKARNMMNGHKSKVLWFTGLSGSGKSTIANALEKKLHTRGLRTYILDGDNIRKGLNNDLGFTNADRIENIRRIGEVAKLMVDAGIIVLTAFISPFRAERHMVKNLFEKNEFIEVYVDIPITIAEKRDPKGLYKKARKGEIPNFTGINSLYEKPNSPDIHIKTHLMSVDETIDVLLKKLNFDDL